ncbi:MAG: carbohydrate-binding domain-containing protein [Clostridia bacterium]|nr:carbohydrate-binding domain-containing protein [Clostridia bacterium]
MKKTFFSVLSLLLVCSLLTACGWSAIPNGGEMPVTGSDAPPITADFALDETEMFTERDRRTEYDSAEAVTVLLNGAGGTASSDSAVFSGSRVTLTAEATYLISGTLTDGQIVVDAPDTAKLRLVFGGVEITSASSAALYIKNADKVFLTLAAGTENTLANGGGFTAVDENNIDGALFSKQDLTLNGEGRLTVTSPAGHGIVCKDDLVLTGGSYTVNSASHGLDVNDSVRLTEASLSFAAGKDAIHVENEEDIAKGFFYMASGRILGTAEGDGVTASATLQMDGGEIHLTVGGGYENGTKEHSDHFGGFMGGPGLGGPDMGGGGMRPRQMQYTALADTDSTGTSMKGLKAASGLLISGGTVTIDSADDALHSNGSMILNGGSFTLASGDDGIHAEETLSVTAGEIAISTCYEGLEALHVDVRGGKISLTADDDGINAAGGVDQSGITGGRDGTFGGKGGKGGMGGMSAGSGSVKISGGVLRITSSGDGIDANGTLEISGGHVTVEGPTQGDTATLDYDMSATVSGGTFIGTGAAGMAQSFSGSSQGVIAVSVGSQRAGTAITLKDSAGNVILTHTPNLDFAVVILSDPALTKGESYTLIIGTEEASFKAS